MRHRLAAVRPRTLVMIGGLAACAVAAAVLFTAGRGGGSAREPGGAGAEPAGGPHVLGQSAYARRKLGGDPRARISLPPRGRWFGFSGAFFAWTGTHPRLDHGLTPERTAADAVAAGADSARVMVGWWDLEPRPGQVNRAYLDRIDRFVDALERRGGRVLLVLGSPPPWASARPGDEGAPPRKDARIVSAFARYARFVAGRWPRAVAIETWNEPNGIFSWRPRPDPEHYTALHRAAAAAIKRAVPGMRVLVGGLAASVEDPRFMRPSRYLRRMYAAGLQPSDYDGLAVHPYPVQGRVSTLDRGPFAEGLHDFRRGHARHDRRPEIWVTETGATTSGPNSLSPAQQSTQILRLVRKLLTMPRVKGVYLHTQYDFEAVRASSPERGFGVLTARGSSAGQPKPSFCALRRLARNPPPFAGCRR